MSRASDDAARKRADYSRALREELDQVERAGKAERVEAIKAELKRVEGKPAGRRSAEPTEA